MADHNLDVDQEIALREEELRNYVHEDRRYVGTKETVAYIFEDFSKSFNISKYQNRFIWDVVKIDFAVQGIVGIFTGIWDVINDTFIGAIVDRTRTRWGKFRPYLIFMQIPLTLLGTLYWFMPYFFPDTSTTYVPKLIFYFALGIVQETAGTFTGIANGGLQSVITPHPVDRVRLITQAQFWSGWFGEKLPELLMGLFLDLINSGTVSWSKKNLFVGMGILTSFVSAAAALFFFIVTRERVLQTVEKPSIKQGLKAILNNKPILLIVLSSFLGNFKVSQSRSDYYLDVLGSATLQTIVGIPASPVSSISYLFIKPIRKKFSTKFIWIAEDLYTDMLWLAVFGIGSINKNYQKRGVMVPVMMLEEVLEMMVYGLRKVVPKELENEAMDYCEWKNGYRTEAMTSVARGLVDKLQGIVMNSIKNFVMKGIGYIQGKGSQQTDATKWWLFALGTGVPVITGALGVLPKFFYPLTGARRDKMYAELLERRRLMAERVSNADADELRRIGEAELRGEYLGSGSLDD